MRSMILTTLTLSLLFLVVAGCEKTIKEGAQSARPSDTLASR